MMTRREWIRQGAKLGTGFALAGAVPGLAIAEGQVSDAAAKRQVGAGAGSYKGRAR